MSGINKAILVGNLGKDVEVKFMQNGTAMANISVATTESWIDKETGKKTGRTEWHNVSVFGKTAEYLGRYARKGTKVYVEGKIETKKYTKDGIERQSTNIVVGGYNGKVEILDKKSEGSNPLQAGEAKPPERISPVSMDPISTDTFDDDIPF